MTEQSDKKSVLFYVASLAVILLPIIYFLGVGPAIWIIRTTDPRFHRFVYAVYGPLEWFYDAVPPLQPLLDFYMNLWR